jgi:DNA polymerase (family 10)
MYDAGGWVLLESAIADLPVDLRWLFESGAVTIEQLAALHSALGVTTYADIVAEVAREAIRRVPGLDEAVEGAIADSLRTLRSAIPRMPLGRAMSLADPILAALRGTSGVDWAEPVGSLRRGQDMIGDIEIVASTADPNAAFDGVLSLPDIAHTLHRGPRRLYILTDRVQIGVRCPPPEAAGATLLHLTGTAAHLQKLGAHASTRGWTLEPEGLRPTDAAPDTAAAGQGATVATSEAAMYAALGLPWIPPEIRNGDDEVAAAAERRLPTLLSRKDIRGDLHMHTTWSDGRDATAVMVETCVALGYEYIAITDHSPHAASSRTLTTDAVKKQAQEIAALRERFPNIAILHGCEVDIMADGKLDFSDRILERFDIVLASLHERLGHSPEQLLSRYLTAMRHPLVTLITHPTNRIIPYRRGYDLDWDRLFAAAIETRTAVEIDGAPPHLDMDGALSRRAIAAGVTVTVDSDCHRADALDRQMELGVITARRGWVEPRHVLNTRAVADVRAFISAKRAD